MFLGNNYHQKDQGPVGNTLRALVSPKPRQADFFQLSAPAALGGSDLVFLRVRLRSRGPSSVRSGDAPWGPMDRSVCIVSMQRAASALSVRK